VLPSTVEYNEPTASKDETISEQRSRTHPRRPSQELVKELDQLVGLRRRSDFIAGAVKKKLGRVKLIRAAEEFRGALADVDIPGYKNRMTRFLLDTHCLD
jgi:hypothetical protein